MLTDDGTTVDADDVASREGFANNAQGLGIKVRLVVCRHQYSPVDNQEVGVSGREPIFTVIDGVGHGQLHQSVGLALHRP